MYVDNGTANNTNGTVGTNTTIVATRISGRAADTFGRITGTLDEVAIWNKELTAAEVSELYNSGNGLAYPFTTGTNAQINIGDAWKAVIKIQQNIGDVWKDVFG